MRIEDSWTREELREFREAWKAHIASRDIALRFGMEQHYVAKVARRLGLRARPSRARGLPAPKSWGLPEPQVAYGPDQGPLRQVELELFPGRSYHELTREERNRAVDACSKRLAEEALKRRKAAQGRGAA